MYEQVSPFPQGTSPGSADADVPPQVPGFTVERELGRGGSSRVWLVRPVEGGEALALKVPHEEVETSVASLDHELRAIGELRHDHLVRPYGGVETDQGPGLLHEYFPGGSLGHLVRGVGPLPLGQVVTTLVPIAQALGELHGHGVVHGDVSPGNVLFTVEGRPALSDLGCSGLLGGDLRRGGTPGFRAPEVDGPGVPGSAADVYSLAAVGWYALTGRAPAATRSRAPLTLTLPEIPREVVILLEAGLAEDPAERPTAAEFATACYDWCAPEPVDLVGAAHPSVAVELPTRRPPSHRAPARGGRERTSQHRRRLMLIVALVLLVGASGFAVVRHFVAQKGGTVSVGTAPAETTEAADDPEFAVLPSPSAPEDSGEDTAVGTSDDDGREEEDPAAAAQQAAAALGEVRTQALEARDPVQVADYTVEGSPAQEHERALVEQLLEQNLVFEGLELAIEPAGEVRPVAEAVATPESADGAQVTMRVPVEITVGAHSTVEVGSGAEMARQEEPVQERLELEMVQVGQWWKLQRILPVGS